MLPGEPNPFGRSGRLCDGEGNRLQVRSILGLVPHANRDVMADSLADAFRLGDVDDASLDAGKPLVDSLLVPGFEERLAVAAEKRENLHAL